MGWREGLQERWGFTRNEVIAMLFLAGMFALGGALRWVKPAASSPPGELSPAIAAADSEFLARSRVLFLSDPPSSAPRTDRAKPKPAPRPGSVDINTATLEQLVLLPGIGKATAEKILSYRAENGPFGEPEELMDVPGIGPRKFERIRPFLRTP